MDGEKGSYWLQQGIFNNNLTIEWDIFNKCNVKCAYCELEFHRHENERNLPFNLSKHLKIVDIMNNIHSSKNLLLNVLGGEPTLFPHLEEVINKLNPEIRIRIYSNNTINREFHFKNDIEWYLTYHPSEVDEDLFLFNLKEKIKIYSRIQVLIMIFSKEEIAKTRKLIEFLTLNDIHFDIGKPFDLNGKYINDIDLNAAFDMPKNIKINNISDSYYNQSGNKFGQMCSKKLFFLDINGNVSNFDWDGSKFNILDAPDYFNSIDMSKSWYCPNTYCNLLPESEYSKTAATMIEKKIYTSISRVKL